MKILTAIDSCNMEDDNRPTLTIGKQYDVWKEDDLYIYITDDEGTEHLFDHAEVGNHFKLIE
jgi:uncharacterized protein (DUF779 family)